MDIQGLFKNYLSSKTNPVNLVGDTVINAMRGAAKTYGYNPDNNRIFPSSPYWQSQDAGNDLPQGSMARFRAKATAPIESMVMAGTTAPVQSDPLADSLNSFIKQKISSPVTAIKSRPNPDMSKHFSPQGVFEVVEMGNGGQRVVKQYQSAAQARKAIDMMPTEGKAGLSYSIRDVTPEEMTKSSRY